MKPRLILHIGASKAGSSAIQGFLKDNSQTLAKAGVIVPSDKLDLTSEITGEQIWFLEQAISKDIKEGTDIVTRRMLRLLEESTQEDKPLTIIVSAENMSNSQGHQWLFAKLRDKFEIKVLIYIRRQDDFLMSSWQQWYLKTSPDFWAWLVENVGTKGNWFDNLEVWRDIYGVENMDVRIFERSKLIGQDLITDFCQAIDVKTEGLLLDVGTRNPSHSVAVQEIAHAANNLFTDIHDNEFYQMVTELTGASFHKKNGQTFLNKRQRVAIMGKYFTSNQNVIKTYFPDMNPNEPLFAPIAGSSEVIGEHELERQKMAILTTMVYALYKRQKQNK